MTLRPFNHLLFQPWSRLLPTQHVATTRLLLLEKPDPLEQNRYWITLNHSIISRREAPNHLLLRAENSLSYSATCGHLAPIDDITPYIRSTPVEDERNRLLETRDLFGLLSIKTIRLLLRIMIRIPAPLSA